MKTFSIGFFLFVLGQSAVAQSVNLKEQLNKIDMQRVAISAERNRLETSFLGEEVACYKKFAVNSCLGKLNTRRRETMTDLRRQEFFLNDEVRKIKGEEQIRKTQEKSSPENQQQAADGRAKALDESQERLKREKNKQQERRSRQENEQAARATNAERLSATQKKIQARADKQADGVEEAKNFNQRQKEAQERKAQHESDQLKRTKPAAKSLPIPEGLDR